MSPFSPGGVWRWPRPALCHIDICPCVFDIEYCGEKRQSLGNKVKSKISPKGFYSECEVCVVGIPSPVVLGDHGFSVPCRTVLSQEPHSPAGRGTSHSAPNHTSLGVPTGLHGPPVSGHCGVCPVSPF